MDDLLFHPVLPFLIGAVLVWFAPRRVGNVIMVAVPVVALVQLSQLTLGTSIGMTYVGFDLEVFRVDRLAMPFAWIFVIAALIAGIYGLSTMQARERTAVLAYAGAALGVVFAGDLMTFFFFWEIKAIASAFVILSRKGGNSGRAGTRYLFVHLLGGKMLLGGVLWHLASTGSLEFTAFELTGPTSMILFACLLSAAAPPLHAWLKDGYPEATVPGTVFLSAFTTKAAIYALCRGFPGTQFLIYLGVFMALYGVAYAMLENDTRRLLSYHIVSQVGYMVAAVGIGTEMAINGATAHAFAHILYKGLLLMGVGAVLHATGRSKMSQLGGIANRMRGVMVLYMIGAVSISSVPFFSGFVSKEIIVEAGYQSELGWLVLLLQIAAVGTFLSTGLKLPFGTWFGKEGWGPTENGDHPIQVGRVPTTMYAAMGLCAALNVAIGLYPAAMYELMPFAVDYTPYSFGKVVEKTQILTFTALAYWLMIDQLQAKAKVTLDTDWLYRTGPRIVTGWWLGRRSTGSDAAAAPAAPAYPGEEATDQPIAQPTGQPTAAPSGAGVSGAVATSRATVVRFFSPPTTDDPPPVLPTWVLGAVMLGTSILVLLASLT